MTYSTLISASVAKNPGCNRTVDLKRAQEKIIARRGPIWDNKYQHFSQSRWNPSVNSYSQFSTDMSGVGFPWNLSHAPGTMTSLMTGLSKIKEDEATEFRMLRALGRKFSGKTAIWEIFSWMCGAKAITWCTMTFQKFSSKRSSVFCKTSVLDSPLWNWECVI